MIKRVFLCSAAFVVLVTLNGCTTTTPPAVAKGKQTYTEDAPSLGSGIRRTYTADTVTTSQSNIEQADTRNARSGAGLGSNAVLGAGR